MIQVRISSDALEDLEDGFQFYELQEPGLGDFFLSQLRADIDGRFGVDSRIGEELRSASLAAVQESKALDGLWSCSGIENGVIWPCLLHRGCCPRSPWSAGHGGGSC
jgi:hypothetical protein